MHVTGDSHCHEHYTQCIAANTNLPSFITVKREVDFISLTSEMWQIFVFSFHVRLKYTLRRDSVPKMQVNTQLPGSPSLLTPAVCLSVVVCRCGLMDMSPTCSLPINDCSSPGKNPKAALLSPSVPKLHNVHPAFCHHAHRLSLLTSFKCHTRQTRYTSGYFGVFIFPTFYIHDMLTEEWNKTNIFHSQTK